MAAIRGMGKLMGACVCTRTLQKLHFLGSIPLISNPHYEHLQFVKKHSSNKHFIPQEHIKKLHEVASGHFGKVYKGKI